MKCCEDQIRWMGIRESVRAAVRAYEVGSTAESWRICEGFMLSLRLGIPPILPKGTDRSFWKTLSEAKIGTHVCLDCQCHSYATEKCSVCGGVVDEIEFEPAVSERLGLTGPLE